MGKKSAKGYERELKSLIYHRTGEDCDVAQPWLAPQIRATAANMVILDKVQKELEREESYVSLMIGSTGFQKSEVNPLLAYYDKMQRTLMMQFAALGLNFNATPSKMTESTRKTIDDDDPMKVLYEEAKRNS